MELRSHVNVAFIFLTPFLDNNSSYNNCLQILFRVWYHVVVMSNLYLNSTSLLNTSGSTFIWNISIKSQLAFQSTHVQSQTCLSIQGAYLLVIQNKIFLQHILPTQIPL